MKLTHRFVDQLHEKRDKKGRRLRCTGLHPFHMRVDPNQIKAEPDCECGRAVRHTHCPHCGHVDSVGDWDAKPIMQFHIEF